MFEYRLVAPRLFALFALLVAELAAAQITLTRGAQLAVDVAADGRIAMDLRGDLWIVPSSGGDATQLTQNLKSVQRPKWSPDASRIAYLANNNGVPGLWIINVDSQEATAIDTGSRVPRNPRWHPDGERLIYAADTGASGFDLWEVDVATGLKWRLSQMPGDETEPAWSANGRDLVYISQRGNHWSLMLRRHGQRDRTLLTRAHRIAAPSWRPDGSLITFFSYEDGRPTLQMAILSRPVLIRTYADNENFLGLPVSWQDRSQMVFVANGEIRKRQFDAWKSRPLSFRATLYPPPNDKVDSPRPELTWQNEPTGELVIHAARLFDGINNGYQENLDIVIRGGRIAAVENHRERPDNIVIDMGDLTIVPGMLDVAARLPANLSASHGPDLLAMGITTVVGQSANNAALAELWSGKTTPGPRLLDPAVWSAGNLSPPEFDVTAAVSTSVSTGQTSGLALSMQLRSLAHAGLNPEQSLRALGVNAAGAIRADPYLGRIAVGAAADLVFLDGDPVRDSSALLNVVAVVRNGRFYSVSGLYDRAKAAEDVE